MPILSAAQIKGRFLKGIDPASTDDDAAIEATVDAADRLLAQALGYPENAAGTRTLASTSYDLHVRGKRVYRKDLYLPAKPVSAITQIDVEIGDSSEEVTSTDYELRGSNRLYRKVGKWPRTDAHEIRVRFTAGYASLDVDHPLGVALGMLTAHLWNAPKTQGRASISAQGKSVAVVDGDAAIPPQIKSMIAGYATGF